MIAIPPTADLADLLVNIAEFFVAESCGQCVPCRVGTVRQLEALERLGAARQQQGAARQQQHAAGQQQHAARQSSRQLPTNELRVLADLDAVMTDASICGLGQTAASAIRSAINLNLLGTAT